MPPFSVGWRAGRPDIAYVITACRAERPGRLLPADGRSGREAVIGVVDRLGRVGAEVFRKEPHSPEKAPRDRRAAMNVSRTRSSARWRSRTLSMANRNRHSPCWSSHVSRSDIRPSLMCLYEPVSVRVSRCARLPVVRHERESAGPPGGGEGQRPTVDIATVQGFPVAVCKRSYNRSRQIRTCNATRLRRPSTAFRNGATVSGRERSRENPRRIPVQCKVRLRRCDQYPRFLFRVVL